MSSRCRIVRSRPLYFKCHNAFTFIIYLRVIVIVGKHLLRSCDLYIQSLYYTLFWTLTLDKGLENLHTYELYFIEIFNKHFPHIPQMQQPTNCPLSAGTSCGQNFVAMNFYSLTYEAVKNTFSVGISNISAHKWAKHLQKQLKTKHSIHKNNFS